MVGTKYMLPLMLAAFVLKVPLIAEIVGTVRTAAGDPLPDVRVLSESGNRSVTDKNGIFRLPYATVVTLHRGGFQPIVKAIAEIEDPNNIVLTRIDTSEWIIPSCTSPSELAGTVRVPRDFQSSLIIYTPDSVTVSKNSDVDHTDAYIRPKRVAAQESIHVMFGPNVSSGAPPKVCIISSARLSARSWRTQSGELEDLDFRGQTADGRQWRWINFQLGFVSYHAVSKNSAELFDRLIDQMCSEHGK
jgi:hypothetical protein